MERSRETGLHNANQVLVEESKFTRTLILNRPRQLNAVSYEMVSQLRKLFISYELDSNVKLVILKGNGKSFCAGADLRAVVQRIYQGVPMGSVMKFFRDEFSLDYILTTYSKPRVSLLDGTVIGAGAGLSMPGKFRIATENSMFMMPEPAIGTAPNGGGSYYLSRLPGFLGEFLALTSTRFDGTEMLACGIATHFVPAAKLESLEAALRQVNTSDPTIISLIIDEFSQRPPLKENSPYKDIDIINKCFSKNTMEEILSTLESEAAASDKVWILEAIRSLKKASPISLKFSLRSIRIGRQQGIGQCVVMEYRLMYHILRRKVSSDLFEGCRAILIDKDRNPRWEPCRVEAVSEEMVDHYFSKVDEEGWQDLQLPSYVVARL